MPRSGQLVSRFSTDGEDSFIGHPEAIDLANRGAFQAFAIPEVNEKENIVANGDDASGGRRQRKSTFIRRLTSKLRLAPSATNSPHPTSPPGPLSPSRPDPPPTPQLKVPASIELPGNGARYPTPPLSKDLSVQEREQDSALDKYFGVVSQDDRSRSSEEDEEWMTEARKIRGEWEARNWHGGDDGVKKAPIYPEVLTTPQFGRSKSTSDLRPSGLPAPEPTTQFEVIREFTVLRPRPLSAIPPTAPRFTEVLPQTRLVSAAGLHPHSATARTRSISPRTSRASLQPPFPPPARELPPIPMSTTLTVPSSQPTTNQSDRQSVRTRKSAPNLAGDQDTSSSSSRRASDTDTFGVSFPVIDDAKNIDHQEPQDIPVASTPSTPGTSQANGNQLPLDFRGRSERRKSFVEQSLHSLQNLRKSFSKARPGKAPPVPSRVDASPVPPLPASPLSLPVSPTNASFSTSGRSSSGRGIFPRTSNNS